nr:putative DNA repair ATPase SbcC [Oceanusvirus sp.]
MDDIFSPAAVARGVTEGLDEERTSETERWLSGENLELPTDRFSARALEKNEKIRKAILQDSETASIRPRRPKLSLSRIDWRWIFCYGPSNSFDFDDKAGKTVILSGRNGSGKTAFLETVVLSLFGTESPSRSGKATAIVNRSMPEGGTASTSITLVVNDQAFRIKRDFSLKNDKVSQKATVIDVSSGGIVCTGKTVVDKWVASNVGTADGFLMSCMVTQRNDHDFLSMKAADQRALVDQALQPRDDIIAAIAESRKAHKWLGDSLAASAETAASFADVDDDSLVDAICRKRDAARIETLARAKAMLVRVSRKIRISKARELARLAELERKMEDVDVDSLSKTPASFGELCNARDRADRELADWERRRPPPCPFKPVEGDSVDSLRPRVEKYRQAVEAAEQLCKARTRVAGPFNHACWACSEREKESGAVAAASSRLEELGVDDDPDKIRKKLRGYEKRLEACEAAEKLREWTLRRDVLSAEAEKATIARDAAELAELKAKHGGGGEGRSAVSSVPDTVDSSAAADASRAAASRWKAEREAMEMIGIRKMAIRERMRAGDLSEAASLISARAKRLKETEKAVADYYASVYNGTITGYLTERTTDLLGDLGSSKPLSTSWSDKGFSFVIGDVPVEKACGFERAAYGLAVRIAISALGVGSVDCKQLFLDEAFASFDGPNSTKIPDFFGRLLNHFDSVTLVTHDSTLSSSIEGCVVVEASNGTLSL